MVAWLIPFNPVFFLRVWIKNDALPQEAFGTVYVEGAYHPDAAFPATVSDAKITLYLSMRAA